MDFSDFDSTSPRYTRFTTSSPLLPTCNEPCCNTNNSHRCAAILFGLLFTVVYNVISVGGMIWVISYEEGKGVKSSYEAWPLVGPLLLVGNSAAGNWLLIGGCVRGVQDPSLLFVPALAINVSP